MRTGLSHTKVEIGHYFDKPGRDKAQASQNKRIKYQIVVGNTFIIEDRFVHDKALDHCGIGPIMNAKN